MHSCENPVDIWTSWLLYILNRYVSLYETWVYIEQVITQIITVLTIKNLDEQNNTADK